MKKLDMMSGFWQHSRTMYIPWQWKGLSSVWLRMWFLSEVLSFNQSLISICIYYIMRWLIKYKHKCINITTKCEHKNTHAGAGTPACECNYSANSEAAVWSDLLDLILSDPPSDLLRLSFRVRCSPFKALLFTCLTQLHQTSVSHVSVKASVSHPRRVTSGKADVSHRFKDSGVLMVEFWLVKAGVLLLQRYRNMCKCAQRKTGL